MFNKSFIVAKTCNMNMSRFMSTFTSSKLKVYGHYASQPARSLLWLLAIKKLPFEFIKVEPMGGGTRNPEYKAKFPTGLVPAIDDNGFLLAESSAIMQYLCEKHDWNDFWPLGNSTQDIQQRAKLNEYLSHHHHSTRLLTIKCARELFLSLFVKKDVMDGPTRQQVHDNALKFASEFERKFLKPNLYIGGSTIPTIADLAAYTEVAQMEQLGLARYENMPVLRSWLDRVSNLPEHDNVHQTVLKIAQMGGLHK